MPPIPVGHVLLKFRMKFVDDPEEMICTLGAETTAASTTERIAVANSAMDTWGDNILPLQSIFYNLTGVDAVFGTAGGDVPISSTDPARTGAETDAPLPNNTAVLVQKVSGVGGRRNRGRMYIPGVPETEVNGAGSLVAPAPTTWATALTNFLLGIESGTFLDRAVIFHSLAPLTPTIIEQLRVDERVATQRRRMRP